MRVLLLTNRVPFPANSGYPIVIYNTISGLLDEGVEVHLFSLNPSDAYTDISTISDPLFNAIHFQSVSIDRRISLWRLMTGIFAKRSWQISRFYNSVPAARLRKLLSQQDFDIIQIEGLFVMPYLGIIRQNSRAKVVYREHNVEHLISGTSASSETSPLKRIYLRMIARRMLKFELENLNRTDAVLTINSADRGHLISAGCKVQVANFPVAINPDKYEPNLSQTEYPSIFHIGTLNTFPAAEGLSWFIHHVWKDLQALNAGLTFHIAGREIPRELYAFENGQFIIHDEVDDPKQFINSKQVMIVPLRTGSGMRVKIIEGMAMKKCVIATSVGAEGINYEHGKNILIADTAGEFYKSILKAITDRKLCEEIGENARALVEKEYNIKHNSSRLISFYRELA